MRSIASRANLVNEGPERIVTNACARGAGRVRLAQRAVRLLCRSPHCPASRGRQREREPSDVPVQPQVELCCCGRNQ